MDEEKTKQLENEAEIVEKAKTDEAAFTILYNFYFPKIYGYVFKRVGQKETAEDLVSGIFLKAFTHLKKYEQQGFTFGAWLYRIATNSLCDHYRKNRRPRETSLEEADNAVGGEDSPIEAVEKKQQRAEIEKILEKIPRRYQEIIHLRYFAELEIEEISAALKINKAHASVLIHRALKCFKDKALFDYKK